MPILEIDGVGEVEVGDGFTAMSGPEQQQFVDEIAASGQSEGTIYSRAGQESAGDGFFDRTGQLLEAGGREFIGSSAEGTAAVMQSLDIAPEMQLDLRRYAEEQDVEISQIPGIKPIMDAEGVGDAVSSIFDYTRMSLPAMGASIATGALTGGVIGLAGSPIGALFGAIGGGAAALYLSFVGNNVEETRRVTGRDTLTEDELSKAQLAAIPQALGDSLINRLIPFKASPKAMINVLKKTIAGAGVEGSTEVSQDALTILQANNFDLESLRTPDAKRRLTEAALAGAGAGGTITGISGLVTRVPVETEAGAETAPLEAAVALSEAERLQNTLDQYADSDTEIFKALNASVQGLTEGPDEVTFETMSSDIDAQLEAVQDELKAVPEDMQDGKTFKSLSAREAVLKSTKFKIKDLRVVMQQSKLDEDVTLSGEVRDPTKMTGRTLGRSPLSSLIRSGTQAVSPMLAAAAKNPVMHSIVSKMTAYDPEVKRLSQVYIKPIYDIQQSVSKYIKLPLTSSVNKRVTKAITGILNANRSGLDEKIIVNDEITKVMSENNIPEAQRSSVITAANGLKTNYDTQFKDAVKEGMLDADEYRVGYVPLNHSWIRRGDKGIRQFTDSVSKVPGISRTQAERIGKNIVEDFQKPDPEFSAKDFAERGSIMKGIRKEAGFEKERTLPQQITDQLLRDGLVDDNIFRVSTRYGQQMAQAITLKKFFGDKIVNENGTEVNAFKQLLDALAKLDSSEDMTTAVARGKDIYSALQGNYNPSAVTPGGKNLIRKLIQAEYILTLSTAGLTALTEPIIMLSRLRPGDAMYAIPKALNIAYRKSIRDIFPHLKKSELEEEFETLLYGIDAILSERLISSSAIDVVGNVTETYFKLNLLSQVTQFSRGMAYFAGKRAIDRDLAVARTIPETKSAIRDKKNAMLRLSELGLKDLDNITPEQMKVAEIKLIDDIIMSPNVVNRPLWMANPILAPVAQLKSFMFVFGNTVGARAWNEIARGKTLQGDTLDTQERFRRTFQFTTTFVLLTGAIGFLNMFKDAIRNFDDEQEDYDTASLDFWTNAMIGSNILGPYSIIFQALKAPEIGVSPLVSILGPGAGSFERLLTAAGRYYATGNSTPVARELLRMIPFAGANPSVRRSMVKDFEDAIDNGTLNVDDILASLQ
jgi:hypothetical protein